MKRIGYKNIFINKIMNIIFFKSGKGLKKLGTEYAPLIFKKYLKNINKKFFYINNSYNLFINLKNLYEKNNSLLSKNNKKKPIINIGGDHSMAISTIASSLNYNKNTKIIYIDAHPDINNYENSKTKNYHGMPLSFLSNIDNNKKLSFIDNKLNLNNLLYIGIRDIDSYEKEIIKKHKIQYINVFEINYNLNYTLNKINKFINNEKVHISLDIDSIEPNHVSITGLNVPNGINKNNLKILIDHLMKNYKIINFDISELNFNYKSKIQIDKSIYNLKFIFSNLNLLK